MSRAGPLRQHSTFVVMAAVCAAVGLAAFIVAICALILAHYPVNHIGFDIRWLYCVAVLGTIWCGLLWRSGWAPGWLVLATLMLSVGLAAAVMAADGLNLLVQYEVWIKRGMPNPFH